MKKKTKYTVAAMVLVAIAISIGFWHVNSYDRMEELRQEFSEEFEIAGATSRINIGSEIRELRDIQDKLEDMTVPPWAYEARDHLNEGMEETIQAFLSFQSQDDQAVTTHFSNAADEFEAYNSLIR